MPPEMLVILLLRSRLVLWTLFGAVNGTEADDSPTGMVMVWPLASFTTRSEPVTLWLTDAV
ncbi:hypothetical protein D3C80_1939880 [compost metagenome]